MLSWQVILVLGAAYGFLAYAMVRTHVPTGWAESVPSPDDVSRVDK